MPRIAIGLVQPGMILAAEVQGPGGQVIAGTGATLTAKHLTAFVTWGVHTVPIEAGSGPTPDPHLLALSRRTVAPRFSGQPTNHPFIREIFRIAVERRLLQLAEAKAKGR